MKKLPCVLCYIKYLNELMHVMYIQDKDVHVPSLPLSSGQAYSSNGEVPSPPKSLLLSPKVISDSNSTSPSVDVQTTAISVSLRCKHAIFTHMSEMIVIVSSSGSEDVRSKETTITKTPSRENPPTTEDE